MSLWEQLNSRTLFGSAKATASQVNAQTKDIHLEQNNRGVLLDSVLINDALFRTDGGSIPGTSKVVAITSDDSGTKFLADKPNPGEVWSLFGFGIIEMTNRSGAVAHDVMIYDGSNYSYVAYDSASDSSFPFSNSAGYPFATIDENTQVVYSATGTFDTAILTYTAVRVR